MTTVLPKIWFQIWQKSFFNLTLWNGKQGRKLCEQVGKSVSTSLLTTVTLFRWIHNKKNQSVNQFDQKSKIKKKNSQSLLHVYITTVHHHRCWSTCTWWWRSHRGTSAASLRSTSPHLPAPSPSCLLSDRSTTQSPDFQTSEPGRSCQPTTGESRPRAGEEHFNLNHHGFWVWGIPFCFEQFHHRWSLEVQNSGGRTAYVRSWRIVLYGTAENHNDESSWSLDETDHPLRRQLSAENPENSKPRHHSLHNRLILLRVLCANKFYPLINRFI